MPTLREIKRRISSVKNISQVTRALEAVSASRVRKAQEQVLNSRPYADKAWEVLVNVAAAAGENEHPLLASPEQIEAVDIILVTSDRSLCGAYNDNIIRVAQRFADNLSASNIRWIAVGRKGRDYLVRTRQNIAAEFSKLPTPLRLSDVIAIGKIVIDDFLAGTTQEVFIAYTDFVNTLIQRPTVVNLLPLKRYEPENTVQAESLKAQPDATTDGRDYLYEPNPMAILDEVIPRFTTLEVYHAMLEALASEHSARMIAMRNASENATALAGDLTLMYNKARQAAITSEILDIVGGVNALENAKKADADSDIIKKVDNYLSVVGGELRGDRA